MFLTAIFNSTWKTGFFSSWVPCHLEAELGVSEKSKLKAKRSRVRFQPNRTFNWFFCGHSWIPILLHKILNIVMYILIIIESNTFPINSNCNKCFQCESNSHPVWILLMWCWTSQSHSIWLSGGPALKKKNPRFLHWIENSCNNFKECCVLELNLRPLGGHVYHSFPVTLNCG